MGAVTEAGVDGLRRRHAVVVHADVADYSRLMADDAATTVATLRRYHALVADAVADAGGMLVNFVGDSFLAVFDDARSAMAAAIAVCGAVRAHNAPLPRQRQAWFRLGIDAGDVVTADDGDWFGDPLNIAARIQALAEVGGVNVTAAVYRALDEPALRLVGVGPRRLKNIPEPVQVYRLAGVAAPPADAGAGADAAPTVAVLPPQHADDPAVATAAAALRLEVVAALGALPGVTVVDRPAAGAPGSAPSSREVSYSLELSVVASGDRLRVYAVLVELETFNRVWGGRWQGSGGDLFALQDAIAADVTRAMEIELIVGPPATIYRSALDAEQRIAVYEAWHHLGHATPEGWRRAVALFGSIVETAPDGVTGHALSAFARWWGAVEGLSDEPDRDLERAGEHAVRGIELDDPTGLSHLVLAALRLHEGGDLDAALDAARASLARRPTCDISYAVLGSVHRYLGDWQAALDACSNAAQLSRLPMPWFATVQASAYYVGERYTDAARLAEHVLDRQPGNVEALLLLAAAQQAMGLSRRARATVAVLRERAPRLRRSTIAARHPFRDTAVLDRWTGHLAAAGLP